MRNAQTTEMALDFEQNVMNYFKCDRSWQLCLYDFTFKNRIPQFLVFKEDEQLNREFNQDEYIDMFEVQQKGMLVVEDYWFSIQERKADSKETPISFLQEQGVHCCNPQFEKAFDHLF